MSRAPEVVRAHGGDVVLEPSEKGATFVVTIPVEAPGRSSIRPPAPLSERPSTTAAESSAEATR